VEIPKLDSRFKSVSKFHLDTPADTILIIEPSEKMTPKDMERLSEKMLLRNCTCHIERSSGGNVSMICGCKGEGIKS
jgi:hypothetical protein